VKKVVGVELDSKRIEYAEHNCCEIYKIPKDKVEFINKSITDAEIEKLLGLQKKPDPRVVFFFDPPWGGLDYQEHEKMNLDSFAPYPMK
jgi:predicted RNA methylase